MILRCLFLRGCCVPCGVCSSLWLKLPFLSAFSDVCAASSNNVLSDDSVETRLFKDARSFLNMLGGWLECLRTFNGSSLGSV